jgi:hypothetical protein
MGLTLKSTDLEENIILSGGRKRITLEQMDNHLILLDLFHTQSVLEEDKKVVVNVGYVKVLNGVYLVSKT